MASYSPNVQIIENQSCAGSGGGTDGGAVMPLNKQTIWEGAATNSVWLSLEEGLYLVTGQLGTFQPASALVWIPDPVMYQSLATADFIEGYRVVVVGGFEVGSVSLSISPSQTGVGNAGLTRKIMKIERLQ